MLGAGAEVSTGPLGCHCGAGWSRGGPLGTASPPAGRSPHHRTPELTAQEPRRRLRSETDLQEGTLERVALDRVPCPKEAWYLPWRQGQGWRSAGLHGSLP